MFEIIIKLSQTHFLFLFALYYWSQSSPSVVLSPDMHTSWLNFEATRFSQIIWIRNKKIRLSFFFHKSGLRNFKNFNRTSATAAMGTCSAGLYQKTFAGRQKTDSPPLLSIKKKVVVALLCFQIINF